jgi:hypothetical protein
LQFRAVRLVCSLLCLLLVTVVVTVVASDYEVVGAEQLVRVVCYWSSSVASVYLFLVTVFVCYCFVAECCVFLLLLTVVCFCCLCLEQSCLKTYCLCVLLVTVVCLFLPPQAHARREAEENNRLVQQER